MTKKKIPITELPIRLFRPLDPNDKCIALIGNLPIRFSGDTPVKVRDRAENWRQEEVAKAQRRKKARKAGGAA